MEIFKGFNFEFDQTHPGGELYSSSEDSFSFEETSFGDWGVENTPPIVLPIEARSNSPVVLNSEIEKRKMFSQKKSLSLEQEIFGNTRLIQNGNTLKNTGNTLSIKPKVYSASFFPNGSNFGNFSQVHPNSVYGLDSPSLTAQGPKKRKKPDSPSSCSSPSSQSQGSFADEDALLLAGSLGGTSQPKKRHRRKAQEIERQNYCPVEGCSKAYGSEGALKMHVRLKHPEEKLILKAISQTSNSDARRIISSSSPSSEEELSHLTSNRTALNGKNTKTQVQPANRSTSTRIVETELRLEEGHCEFFDIPMLSIKLGSWQRTSKFVGDLVATFSFNEKKLVWELASERSLFKMELPFSSLMGIDYKHLSNGITVLGVATKCAPQFYRYPVQPNQTAEWISCGDFTGGYAFNTRLHTIFFAPESFTFPIDYLLRHPRLQNLAEASLPVTEQPEFLLATMDPPLLPNESKYSSAPPGPLDSSPSSLPSADLSNNSFHALSECAVDHRNELLNFPMNTTAVLPCCQEKLQLKQLLSLYTCKCNITHFYSFCLGKVACNPTHHHCTECGKCTPVVDAHCSECSSCTKPQCDCCSHFLSI